MERTKNRALALEYISGPKAVIFAIILECIGNLILILNTNLLTVLVAGFGFFVYVILYSLWKCRTIYGTAIGSVAGAVPPVVGYCAVSNNFDLGAFILFMMMILWQMPHFFSIAMLHLEDYKAAHIPVLPVIKGILRTKIHMVLYIIGFIAAAVLLTLFNYTGYLYLIVATSMSLIWLWYCLKGFKSCNNQIWSRLMFRLSLLTITAICLIIGFDRV